LDEIYWNVNSDITTIISQIIIDDILSIFIAAWDSTFRIYQNENQILEIYHKSIVNLISKIQHNQFIIASLDNSISLFNFNQKIWTI